MLDPGDPTTIPDPADKYALAHWRLGGVAFEFACDCAGLTDRVQALMEPWNSVQLPSDAGGPLPRYRMRARACDGGWEFQGCQTDAGARVPDAEALLHAVEMDAVHAIVQDTRAFLSIHGALVSRGGAGLLMVGASWSGKSTFASALAAEGWHLHGDDVALLFLGPGGAGATAVAVPRRISLRPDSRAVLGSAFWNEAHAGPSSCSGRDGVLFRLQPPPTAGAPVGAILMLDAAPADAAPAAPPSPATPAEALVKLATYTNVARFQDLGAAIARLGPLLKDVPVYQIQRRLLSDMVSLAHQILPVNVAK